MDDDVMCAMAKVAVDRYGGQLEKFVGKDFGTDEILKYIGDRSPGLKTLCLILCTSISNEGFSQLVAKCPLLEDLALFGSEARGIAAMHELRSLTLLSCGVTNDDLAFVLDGCPHLEILDLRDCYNIFVDEALRARCAGIKSLMLPR
nr:unnamed protein product [Digitaria exilis]